MASLMLHENLFQLLIAGKLKKMLDIFLASIFIRETKPNKWKYKIF